MDDDHFRIGDNDRRRALESLTSLAASGHLTVDEFDERSAAAAIARTRGDIKRLFDDIPGVDFTASDDSADASEEAAKPVSLESPDAYDYTMLPDATQLYPAHEYTAANLRFAAHIEPDNPHIIAAQQRAQTIPTLPVTLAREKQTNPFLRVHLPAVQQRIRQLTQQTYDSDEDYFVALRELKNRF